MNAQLNPIFAQIFDTLSYPKADDIPERVEDMTTEEYEELHESRHSLGFDHNNPEFIDAHEAMWTEGEKDETDRKGI